VKKNNVAIAIAAVLLSSSGSLACVQDFPEPLVVPNAFDVLLQDRGHPLIGMEVLVQRYISSDRWETVRVALTDSAGRARFTNVPSGEFVVTTHAASGNDSRAIKVTHDTQQKAATQIELVWPAKKVIVTRSFGGTFISLPTREVPSEPLRAVKVDVLEAHSGHFEASLLTDEQGEFTLKTLPPGIYFLRLSRENRDEDDRIWGWKLEGDVAVEVNPFQRNAPNSIRLELMMTDCGLGYRNANP
jgi:hypothetical protein